MVLQNCKSWKSPHRHSTLSKMAIHEIGQDQDCINEADPLSFLALVVEEGMIDIENEKFDLNANDVFK